MKIIDKIYLFGKNVEVYTETKDDERMVPKTYNSIFSIRFRFPLSLECFISNDNNEIKLKKNNRIIYRDKTFIY